MNVLETKNITMRFGGLTAVNNVSIEVPKENIISLIGPNGAGKTTFFNLLTGIYRPTEGNINICGKPVVGLKPFEVTSLGVGRTFQNIRLFKSMTVLENVMLGQFSRTGSGFFQCVLGSKGAKAEEKKSKEIAMELLDFVGLSHKRNELATSLPYGEQRKVEIARAMAVEPELILLDEPAAGMNTSEKREAQNLIKKIQQRGLTVFLIEHDMKLVMGISDRVIVLDYGNKIAEGAPQEIQKNERVIAAYLGKGGEANA
ncbi:ABC transporter ATP-binding protein [Anaeropeptidivorans aminofermentans]|uniref:ABC transporter ATP-binding protein n=1 Tax=Anaeropeptidivorans aminofermentans TaxID=2934315 RepID=UPI00202538DE|nr:ABC transporter ATP-binding protein [Anaeropeptidivorans aminofermentans]